jgi:hypothetical protein
MAGIEANNALSSCLPLRRFSETALHVVLGGRGGTHRRTPT